MNFETAEKYDIIPEYAGNSEDPAPMVLHCRYLTAPERDKVFKEELLSGSEMTVRITVERPQLFRLSIESIENCKIAGKEVKNAQQFNEARFPGGLYDEIINRMIKANRRDDLKNS